MPITPRFTVRQDDTFLFVDIHVPYVRVSGMDFTLTDGTEFSFYCRPYLLKLHLPGAVLDEDEHAEASYDPETDHGRLTVKLTKACPGEVFPNLDLLTLLLQPRRVAPPAAGPLVQELEGGKEGEEWEGDEPPRCLQCSDQTCGGMGCEEVEAAQLPPDLPSLSGMGGPHSYGFAQRFVAFFRPLAEYASILENPEPDVLPAAGRAEARRMVENAGFDAARYLGDCEDGAQVGLGCCARACVCGECYSGRGVAASQDPLAVAALAYAPHWVSQLARVSSRAADCPDTDAEAFGAFSEAETSALMQIPNKVSVLSLG